jgi:hypothetical protein
MSDAVTTKFNNVNPWASFYDVGKHNCNHYVDAIATEMTKVSDNGTLEESSCYSAKCPNIIPNVTLQGDSLA